LQTQTNQTKTTTRVVAAVLDTHNLVLYKEDGSSINIPQGDPRVRRILDDATPSLLRNNYADVDLSPEGDTTFQDFEEKSGGVVKFFRVAKDKLNTFFRRKPAKHEDPVSIGTVPVSASAVAEESSTESNDAPATKEASMAAAVQEIMQYAVPVTSPHFDQGDVAKQAEIVTEHGNIAVVDNQVVPGVEKIASQFQRAVQTGNTKGMEALIRRMAAVAASRKHSTDDLIKFLERGDLPVAEDGSIIIYKVLRKKDNEGTFVDCHTRKVTQRVGSFVCMGPSLVDHDRNVECSNGLHVARRGYIAGFSGDVCVLAKLAPEDVIAVPTYDANKMRVCGYHIIAQLTPEMYTALRNNKPITDTQAGRELLAKAMAGDHIGRIEEVRIHAANGGDVKITPLQVADAAKPVNAVPSNVLKEITKTAVALENPAEATKDEPVAVQAVLSTVSTLSRKDTAQGLYDTFKRAVDPDEKATALQALKDYKKASKTGWEKLGIPDSEVTGDAVKPGSAPAPAASQTKVQTKKTMSPREQIQDLLPKFTSATGATKIELAKDILLIKKQAKKSWDVLGVSAAIAEQILLRTK